MNVLRTAFVRGLLVAVALVSAPALSSAEPVRTLDRAHIRLGDLVELESAELQALDLGPAPPPGGSRLITRDDVLREVRAQGFDEHKLHFPQVLRVQSASRRFSSNEIQALLAPVVDAALPAGVTRKQIKISRALVTSPSIAAGELHLPKLGRRAGSVELTVVANLVHDGEIVARVPIGLTLEVSDEAAAPVIAKGARVDLVIERGAARISASGVALEAADVGDVASFKVSTTQRVLRARVSSGSEAIVVTP